jgi:hypothetical protein
MLSFYQETERRKAPADTLPTRTQCNRPDRVLARADEVIE